MEDLKKIAVEIAHKAIKQITPEVLLPAILENLTVPENTYLLAIGKAAWGMAKTAKDHYEKTISNGLVLTNYGNSYGSISGLQICEAGHPFPDENSLKYTELILDSIGKLSTDDILLLLSGGGSALLEKPLAGVSLEDINSAIRSLMYAGADIFELNTVRKHLSAVKGGRLALRVKGKITALVLSDVIGDSPAIIASGPVSPDPGTSEEAFQILEQYNVPLSQDLRTAISLETPSEIDNVNYSIIGNNKQFCEAAAKFSEEAGFSAYLYPLHLQGKAYEMGRKVGLIAKKIRLQEQPVTPPCAIILGGETTVKVTGQGKGGRNQELVLGAAEEIKGIKNTVIMALASDGIDGNSQAAGGVVDGSTYEKILTSGGELNSTLINNDSYNLLKRIDSVIETGSTGTNVNDIAVILID